MSLESGDWTLSTLIKPSDDMHAVCGVRLVELSRRSIVNERQDDAMFHGVSEERLIDKSACRRRRPWICYAGYSHKPKVQSAALQRSGLTNDV